MQSIGDWLILVSTFTWALYTVTTRNIVTRRDPLLGEEFGPWIAIGGALVLAGVYVGQRDQLKTRD